MSQMEVKTMGEDEVKTVPLEETDVPTEELEIRVDIFTSTWNHVRYALVTSQEEVDCLLKTHREATVPYFDQNMPHRGAVTHLYRDWAVVHYDLGPINKDLEEGKVTRAEALARIMGILAHEAYHVCEKIFMEMGEESPSSEFTAYTIQTVMGDFVNSISRKIL